MKAYRGNIRLIFAYGLVFFNLPTKKQDFPFRESPSSSVQSRATQLLFHAFHGVGEEIAARNAATTSRASGPGDNLFNRVASSQHV